MADWLVLEDYSVTPIHLTAGAIISDVQYNVPLLRNQGLAAVEWVDPFKSAFQARLAGYLAYRAAKPNSSLPDADLVSLLAAYNRETGGGAGGESNTSSNEGGGAGLAMPKAGVNLPFRTLISSDASVGFDEGASTVDLSVAPPGESNTSSNQGGGAELAMTKDGVDLPFRTLTSGDNSVGITQGADTVDLSVVQSGASGYAQLSFGSAAGGPNADISLAGAALSRLPPASQTPAPFTTLAGLLDSGQWEVVPGANGALRYIGFEADKPFKVDAHLTIRREGASPDKDLFLYLNKGAPPSSGTVESATRQGLHADNGDEAYSVSLSTIISVSPQDVIELWAGAEGGGAPFVFQVQGYSLTITAIAPGG